MAKREVFIYLNGKVSKKEIEFLWEGDNSLKGNRKKIKNLHTTIKEFGLGEPLEVSLNAEGEKPRMLMERNFIHVFIAEGLSKEKYDYEYISGVSKNPDLLEFIKKYNVFTDLAFYGGKRKNTVARSLVILTYLLDNNLLEKYLKKPELKKFTKLYENL